MDRQQAYRVATKALDEWRSIAIGDLKSLVGTVQKNSVFGPDGQTYFLELTFEELPSGKGVHIAVTVDLGNSFKLERIEESIEIFSA